MACEMYVILIVLGYSVYNDNVLSPCLSSPLSVFQCVDHGFGPKFG